MTSNQFHIQKEIQERELNKILQSVRLNSFPKEAKKQVIELCESSIETIHKMRVEVYKQTENFEFKPEKYDYKNERLSKNIETRVSSIGKLQNSLLNTVGELIGQVERAQVDRITGDNFSAVAKTKEYKENERWLLETLEDLKKAILIKEEPKKEKEPAGNDEPDSKSSDSTEETKSSDVKSDEKTDNTNSEQK